MTSDPTAEVPGSILSFTHGDRAAAVQLRRTLTALRDNVSDPHLQRRITDVLDGRTTLRELSRDPAMLAEMGRGMDRFARQWSQMSPEERVALAEAGRRETEQIREQLGMGPELDPAPVGEFGPALREPHADDSAD